MSLPTPSLLEQGRQALAQQNMPLAIDLLGRAVAANPNNADAMALLGMAYGQAGQHAAARQYLQGAAQRQPQNAGFRYQLGLALERAGDLSGAERAYQEALRLNPAFGPARQRLSALGPASRPAPLTSPGVANVPAQAVPFSSPAPHSNATPTPFRHQPAPGYTPAVARGYTPSNPNRAVPDMDAGEAFLRRFGARLIDVLLVVTMQWVIVFVGSLAVAALVGAGRGSDAVAAVGGFGLFLTWFVIPLLLTFTYYVWMHCARGQTLGQMALGIRLMRADGRPPVFPQALLRDTVGMLASGLLCGVGLFWMLWDPDQQTWGDKLSSTYVRRA